VRPPPGSPISPFSKASVISMRTFCSPWSQRWMPRAETTFTFGVSA